MGVEDGRIGDRKDQPLRGWSGCFPCWNSDTAGAVTRDSDIAPNLCLLGATDLHKLPSVRVQVVVKVTVTGNGCDHVRVLQ